MKEDKFSKFENSKAVKKKGGFWGLFSGKANKKLIEELQAEIEKLNEEKNDLTEITEKLMEKNETLIYREKELKNSNVELKNKIETAEKNRVEILDDFPVMIWRSDTNAKYNYFNKLWLKFSGRSIEKEFSVGWIERIHPDDISIREKCFNENFYIQKKYSIEYRLMKETGEYRWIKEEGKPFLDSECKFVGFIGICFDISEERDAKIKLQNSYIKYKSIIEKTHDGIVLVDADGKIVEWNKGNEEITGIKKDEAIGEYIWNIQMKAGTARAKITQEHLEEQIAQAKAFLENAGTQDIDIITEDEIVKPNGNIVQMQNSIFSFQTEKGVMVAAISRDITSLKNSREELKKNKIKIENDNKMKSVIFDLVKNEIHNKKILNEINNVLDFGLLTSGMIEMKEEKVNIRSIIRHLLLEFKEELDVKNIKCIQKIDENVSEYHLTDKERFQQIFINLIENAIRYTTAGEISIYIKRVDRDAGYETIEVWIKDTGIGMSEDEIRKLLKSETIEKTVKKGFGVIVSKEIIEVMGGTLQIESEERVGTTISFSLKIKVVESEKIEEIIKEKLNCKILMKSNTEKEYFKLLLSKENVETVESDFSNEDILFLDYENYGKIDKNIFIKEEKVKNDRICKIVICNENERIEIGKDSIVFVRPIIISDLKRTLDEIRKNRPKNILEEEDEQIADLRFLIESVDGDKETLWDLIGDFKREFPKQLSELKMELVEMNRKKIKEKAHKLKGGISNFGVKKMVAQLVQIEKYCDTVSEEDLKIQIQNIEKEMDKTIEYFLSGKWEEQLN